MNEYLKGYIFDTPNLLYVIKISFFSHLLFSSSSQNNPEFSSSDAIAEWKVSENVCLVSLTLLLTKILAGGGYLNNCNKNINNLHFIYTHHFGKKAIRVIQLGKCKHNVQLMQWKNIF